MASSDTLQEALSKLKAQLHIEKQSPQDICDAPSHQTMGDSRSSLGLLTKKSKQDSLSGLIAEVVELVDTLASGASGGNPVEVRVLFSAPIYF